MSSKIPHREKIYFQKFSPAQFWKLKNGNGALESFVIYSWANFQINRISGFEISRGLKNYTHTDTHDAYFISLVFLRKSRNKTKNYSIKI